jgi:hypothetical protein
MDFWFKNMPSDNPGGGLLSRYNLQLCLNLQGQTDGDETQSHGVNFSGHAGDLSTGLCRLRVIKK